MKDKNKNRLIFEKQSDKIISMKVSVMTLGCKVNKYESDALITKLNSLGFKTTDKLETADVYIINTCAVTQEAEKKSRQMIARCKKFNRSSKIFVCGCASQNNAKQFIEKDVEVVMGTSGKEKIIDYLLNSLKTQSSPQKVEDLQELPLQYQEEPFACQSRTRAYIKIQDGCNNFCSYCIIPYLRGRSRSRSLQSIVDEVKNLDDSIKEIVITGIDVTDYKIDGERGLLTLLKALDGFGKRLRLSSMEEGLIEENFIEGLSKLKNFCPHFHLSLQSGCNDVLKKMNRHYTKEEFASSVKLIRKYFPLAGITTDVIVGFPSESEENFNESFEFVKEMKFSQLHIFKYSQRDGTAAAKLYKDLNPEIKQERLEIFEELNQKLKSEFIALNHMGEVLVEELVQGEYAGYTRNYIRCYISSNENLVGKIINVKLESPYKEGVKAIKI